MHVTEWLKHIEKYANKNVLIFLVGNKLDLSDKRVIDKKNIENFAEEQNLPYIETSAKEGINIEELFNNSINQYLNGIHFQNAEKNIKLEQANTNEKGGCC